MTIPHRKQKLSMQVKSRHVTPCYAVYNRVVTWSLYSRMKEGEALDIAAHVRRDEVGWLSRMELPQ